MMSDGIDLEGVITQLQTENERLRETLMRSKLAHFTQKSLGSITRQDIADVLKDKRFWIGAAAGAAFAIASGIAPYFVSVLNSIRRIR